MHGATIKIILYTSIYLQTSVSDHTPRVRPLSNSLYFFNHSQHSGNSAYRFILHYTSSPFCPHGIIVSWFSQGWDGVVGLIWLKIRAGGGEGALMDTPTNLLFFSVSSWPVGKLPASQEWLCLMELVTINGNVFPVHAMAGYRGSRGSAPLILNLKLNSDCCPVLRKPVG